MDARIERWTIGKAAAEGRGVVTTQHWRASQLGADVLARGGNAIDAIVTAAFALGVVEPWMSGLAACGFMLVAKPGRAVEVVDFAGVAPRRIEPDDYPIDGDAPPTFLGFPAVVEHRNQVGWRAACVPGAPAGLAAALARHGTIGLDAALAPVIDLAGRGLPVDWHTTLCIALAADGLARDPSAAAVYLPGGHPPQPGTHRPLGALVGTLRTLADEGPDALYRGELGARLCADLRAGGSRLDEADLADYRVTIGPAPSAMYRGHRVHVAGPTSGGERLLDALATLETVEPAPGPPGPAAYLAQIAALDRAFATYRRRDQAPPAGGSTTHLNAVDAEGTMACLTFTLLQRFGARVVSPSTGILLNNGMAWFDPRPGRARSLVPGARAQSNKCPALLTRAGEPVIAVGASGANQIVPAVCQAIAWLVDHGMDVAEAIAWPRIDAADRGHVTVDVDLDPVVREALAARYRLEDAQRAVFPKLFAAPAAVVRDPASGLTRGAADVASPVAAAAAA